LPRWRPPTASWPNYRSGITTWCLATRRFSPLVKVRAYSHLLGECPVAVFGTPDLARKYRHNFPKSLAGAAFLFPTDTSALRRSTDQYFEEQGIRPRVVGEFQDSALLKTFGRAGAGLFVAPA